MAVTLTYNSNLTVVETLEANVAFAASNGKSVTYNGLNTTASLNASSTPIVSKTASLVKALASGSGTIDLTAVLGTNGATVDASGLKVVAMKLRGKSTNGNPITIAKGASNGYDAFGASFSITLKANMEITVYSASNATAISSTNKILDLTGTGSQELEVQLIFG